MKLDNEIVIESAELQLLLTEGDTEGAVEKGESLLSKMKKSLSEKIKLLNLFSVRKVKISCKLKMLMALLLLN